MKIVYRVFIILSVVLPGIFLLLFTRVDRTPYQHMEFYGEMSLRLDSLETHLKKNYSSDKLFSGWSKVSITPLDTLPLAGYGGRKPKEYEAIHDSIFIRTIVFKLGNRKAAIVSADLLIFHPAITERIRGLLPMDWSMDEVYLTATHTHSSLGGWAPGFLGEAISGTYNDTIPEFIARKVVHGINVAINKLEETSVGLAEIDLGHLVHNRLVQEKGITDPWLKSVIVNHPNQMGILNFYSAHATCLNSQFRGLSGDFPGDLNRKLDHDTIFDFSLYGAGPVGSMGPVTVGEGYKRVRKMSNQIKSQVDLLPMIGIKPIEVPIISSFRLNLTLREPYAKISENWAIRPFLFNKIAGDYLVDISVLQLGNIIFVGIPGDFSGELAMPLYEKARKLGLNLIVTSFNGGYIGYIVKDEWYDLNKYESRSMSWYGPDNGAYLSEVIERILKILS